MALSISWFVGLAFAALGMLLLGRRAGHCRQSVSNTVLVLGVIGVGLAASLRLRPALLHQMMPLEVSVWLDGLVPVFPWMLLVGVLATGETTQQLRRAAPLMVVLGAVYFLFGGIWMLLPTIRVGAPEDLTPVGIILQNRPDTCVPASAANALRMMGVPASEERMCGIVMAKPTRGSSLARAAYGLRTYLRNYDLSVTLRDIDADQAADTATRERPALIVIRSGFAADHMVVLLGRTDDGNILIANPSPGIHGGVSALPHYLGHGLEVYAPEDFARLYRRGAIIFEDL